MLQNSKRIQSQLFTVESQESQDFLGYSVSPSLASGYQGPGFYSTCHAASSADSLTWAWGNGGLLSLYTALSLHKAVPPCLRKEHGDPLFFFKPPGVCFCSARHYIFGGDHGSRSAWLTSLCKGPLDALTTGPHVCVAFFPTACCVMKGFSNLPHILPSTF